jgi:hypothetical protein
MHAGRAQSGGNGFWAGSPFRESLAGSLDEIFRA